jgi:hypothetical protein
MASGEDPFYDDAAQRFFKEIGLASANDRVSDMAYQASKIRTRNAPGHGTACAKNSGRGRGRQPKRGGYASGKEVFSLSRVVPAHEGMQSSETPAMTSKSPPRMQRKLKSMKSRIYEKEDRLKSEMEEVRKVQVERKSKFREELIDDLNRNHEVKVVPRPTAQEMSDEKRSGNYPVDRYHVAEYAVMRRLQTFRRSRQKVVIGSDQADVEAMPNHKLCIGEGLKQRLCKMRENLFQRRLNLAAFEKGVTDWSESDLRAEVRKRRRDEKKGFNRAWTDKEYEEAVKQGKPRPCSMGCGFQATILERLCCKACAASGRHGPKCERIPMPGYTIRTMVLTDRAMDIEKKGLQAVLDPMDAKREQATGSVLPSMNPVINTLFTESAGSAPEVGHANEDG